MLADSLRIQKPTNGKSETVKSQIVKKNWTIIILISLSLFACKNSNTDEAVALTSMKFSDFVEVENIESVLMRNNSGEFELSENQIKNFRKELGEMIYEPTSSAKGGVIYVIVTIDKSDYVISTSTNGEYAEVHSHIVTKNNDLIRNGWLYFNTNGLNFDNYKQE